MDLTDQVRVQDALAESESKYRMLAENSTDIIVRFGPDGLIRYVSPACRILGLDPYEEIGRPITRVLNSDSLEHARQIICALFSGAEIDSSVSRLHRCRGPNGRDVWLEGNPTLIRDDAGHVIEIVTALRDVTAKREVEIALAMSEQRYRSLAENAPDILTESQLDGTLTYVSQASLAITGFAPHELVGQSSFSLMHDEDAERMRDMCQSVYQSHGTIAPWPIEFRAIHKCGRPIWLESKPILVADPATGRYIGLTDVIRDITGRKALEADLQVARAEAEAAAAVKGEFLANMSHELRTPLTSILGFTRLAIEQQAATGLLRDYIERVDAASQALLATVNDILDFSKLEAGQVDIRPRPIDVDAAVKGSLDLFLPQASAKDLKLSYCCDRPGLAVSCDPDRLRQILLNLVGNAVKFTAVGGVSVSVMYDDREELVVVEVTDTGAGIQADKISALFQRFSQIDGSLTRVGGGTGLGLAICKGLVEAMGGEIGVSSQPGLGSCFWFKIPAPVVHDEILMDGDKVDFASVDGLRVLVVDDHPTNRELARLVLAGLGAETHEACDGGEAVEVAACQPVDVILMDLRMPKLDGMEALKMIRQGRGCNSSTPVLAFTADIDDGTTGALLAAGFDGVVSKPLMPEMLVRAVTAALK
jgi:PAS domain S-box-containing protein